MKLKTDRTIYYREYNKTPQRQKYAKEYYLKNIDKYRERDNNRTTFIGNFLERIRSRRHKYNIEFIEYITLYYKQDFKCNICNKLLDNSSKQYRPHIDHCHTTGKVRGLLCLKCNAYLGWLERNKEKIKSHVKEIE